jgi:hypothetical protein
LLQREKYGGEAVPAPSLKIIPVAGGNIRRFKLPEGFTEDPQTPKDFYRAKVSVSTDAAGFQHRAFLYLMCKEKLEALRRQAQALVVEVHNTNVVFSDRALLRRKKVIQGLR